MTVLLKSITQEDPRSLLHSPLLALTDRAGLENSSGATMSGLLLDSHGDLIERPDNELLNEQDGEKDNNW